MVSPALDLISGPRSPSNGLLTRKPRVPKSERCKDADNVEKLISIATTAPPSEYSLRYITAAGIIDPRQYSPKLADYYTTHGLTLDHIMDRFIDFDMLASVEMYENFLKLHPTAVVPSTY
jgi:hypothetical protein